MKIELLDGCMPVRANPTDAGLDLHSAEELILRIGESRVVRCGFKMQLDKGMEAQIRTRSGMAAKNQVVVLNSPGTVDEGYRGEIMVILANLGPQPYTINKGDRIAQMVIAKVEYPNIEEGKVLGSTDRGDKGFGSTGVKKEAAK